MKPSATAKPVSSSLTKILGLFPGGFTPFFAVAEPEKDVPKEAAPAEDIHSTYYRKLYDENEAKGGPKWLDDYPPATTCRECHPTHYRQWSVSPHAYAQMSPVFNAMHATVFKLTNGSNGDFCIRCHTPVGMNLGEPEFMSNVDRHPTSREGVTCIVCHRIDSPYGKISGRLALERGNLIDVPVTSPNEEIRLEELIRTADVSTNAATESGTKIHRSARFFAPLAGSGFCGSCHDVLLHNGFRLEEAFSEYKRSPAAANGVTCQDCHMGKEHGKFSGDKKTNYDVAPIAIVNGEPTPPRKITNHMFPGPDHSIIHPGIFPHNDRAVRDESEDPLTAKGLATIREWLLFEEESGWGTRAFEKEEWDRVKQGQPSPFPERWKTRAERQKARRILDEQFTLLKEYDVARDDVLRNGFHLGQVRTHHVNRRKGIGFSVEVINATDGHGVPTGFIGERVIFLEVRVLDPGGNLVFTSGDLDPNGDVRDSHSLYVHNHELPLDKQLFTLQKPFPDHEPARRRTRGGTARSVFTHATALHQPAGGRFYSDRASFDGSDSQKQHHAR